MKSLYLRIWLTVVAALALFALISGWLWQRHLEQERVRFEAVAAERVAAWAELVQRSLPPADASPREQAEALREWAFRLRVPMALDDLHGKRIGASESYLRREADGGVQAVSVRLDDGRTLWIARRLFRRARAQQPLEGLGIDPVRLHHQPDHGIPDGFFDRQILAVLHRSGSLLASRIG